MPAGTPKMTSKEHSGLLFRCCSTRSAGRLESGKSHCKDSCLELSREAVDREFQSHRFPLNHEPTALVSTTANLLRAVHLAFRKSWEGEDENEIEIIMLVPSLEDVRLHRGEDLARRAGLDDNQCSSFKSEYIFEWCIPGGCVVHRVTLAVLQSRGFNITALLGERQLISYPNLTDFRGSIATHWRQLLDFDKGALCGLAAGCFGFSAPRLEISEAIFAWTIEKGSSYQIDMVHKGLDDAFLSQASSIGDALQATEPDRVEIYLQLDDLHGSFVDSAAELVDAFSDQPSVMQRLLKVQYGHYRKAKARLEESLAGIYVEIGY